MKTILKSTFINLISLYIIDYLLVGFSLDNNIRTLVTAAVVLTFLNKLVIPLIKLLLLPINLITLGLFRWVANVIALFLLQTLVMGITISPFYFAGFSYSGFTIPSFNISLIFSYIITSIFLRIAGSAIRWIFSS